MNLQLASKFVAKYATIPILESICFRSNGTITATDMECSFVEQIDKAIGDLCVTAKVLTRSQKILGSCNFKITGDKMLIASATGMVELNGREVSDYIHIPVIQGDEYVMNAKALLKGLSSVVDAVREKNFSPVLTGIYVHEEEGQLNFVGTNSFLLKHISFDKEKEPRIVGGMKMILPVVHVRKLIEVLKACTDMDDVRITVGENSVAFATIKYQVVMLKIVGQYPQYTNENIMPTTHNQKTTYHTKEVKKAIELCSLLSDGSYKNISIKLGSISTDCDGQTASYNIHFTDVTKPGTEPVKFRLDGDHLLKSIAGRKKIDVFIIDDWKPIVITSPEDNVKCIIRPMMK